MGSISCHSNQTSYPTGENTFIRSPDLKMLYTHRKTDINLFCGNMKRIRFSASDEMSFENVDRRRTTDDIGWTTDTFIYYKLTYEHSAQVSKNEFIKTF